MEVDKTTLQDLLIFDNNEDEFSIFNTINFTNTSRGKQQLHVNLATPHSNINDIKNTQATITFIKEQQQHWPLVITNGTIMVVEKFYETSIDLIPLHSNGINAFTYKILHGHDYNLVKYSTRYCFDFIKAMHHTVEKYCHNNTPAPLKKLLEQAKISLAKPALQIIYKKDRASQLAITEMLDVAYFVLYKFKHDMKLLLQIFGQLDAWYSMAKAVEKFNLTIPNFVNNDTPVFKASNMYNLLLKQPVPYTIELNNNQNFLFLTGANMAGKSTFIKACGIAIYLAHVGMGVPANNMQLTYFDGLLSNINVIDNIAKGESYFFNEVQRIKATVQKVNNNKKWFILIDELFKGTNVQDAMKCSSTVIEGLLKVKQSLFILSTHLYEIGYDLTKNPNIKFNYFETTVTDDQLYFSYQLKEGISNDRLGYLILKKEGVVGMLEGIGVS